MESVPGYEKLVSAIIERYEQKQDRLELSMQDFKDTSLKIYNKIESDVQLLSNDVSYLVKVIRDGNDPISSKVVDHESRISAVEDFINEETRKLTDTANWKRGAIASVVITVIGVVVNIINAVLLKK